MNFRPRAYIIYYLRPLRLELYGVVVVIAILPCIYVYIFSYVMNMVMLYIVCNQREVEEEKKKKREPYRNKMDPCRSREQKYYCRRRP